MRAATLSLLSLLFAVSLVAAPATVRAVDDHVVDDSKLPQYLYVQSAQSGSLVDNILTLRGVAVVVYFTDRPHRVAGHISIADFVEDWDKGPDNFAADPPNATLSIFEASGAQNAVIELMDPQYTGDAISYTIRVLDGTIPLKFGPSSLFIDFLLPGAWQN